MKAYCPLRQAEHPLPEAGASPPCGVCGAPLVLASRFVLVEKEPVEQGADVADGAAPMWRGHDLEASRPVIVRLSPSSEAGRLRREATILRGLSHPRVPRLLALEDVPGVGLALVLSRPSGACLEAALGEGLRIDAGGGRRFLQEALTALAYLHELSPPVFHRHIQPRALFWDAAFGVSLVDFARATDVVGDAEADAIVARAGYTPPMKTTPARRDLYAVGATLVHLLTRTPPADLPAREQRPDFRPASLVDEELARFLDRLLFPERRDAFASAAEALAALRGAASAPAAPRQAALVLVSTGVALIGVLAAAAFWAMGSASPPPSAPPPPVVVPSTPAPPPPVVVPVPPVPPPSPPVPPPHVEPRAVEPPPKVPVKPTPEPPPPPLPVQSEHEAFLKALRAAVEAKRALFLACEPKSVDRLQFNVRVAVGGALEETALRGQSTSLSRCVEEALKRIDAPKPRTKPVQAEVRIWLAPAFKVAVY